MIIDFHTHAFPDSIAPKAIPILEEKGNLCAYTDGTISDLRCKMEENHIDYSLVLPVATSAKQVKSINSFAIEVNKKYKETHILSFGGLHPDYIDYEEEIIRLKDEGIKGIKLHPPYQDTYIDDVKYINIIDKAFEFGLIVILHAGIDIGIKGDLKITPDRILNMMNGLHHKGKLVLAHMGSWGLWDQVYSKLLGKDLYIDTAFSLGYCNQKGKRIPLLSKEDFKRFVLKHGADKILFATDCPWAIGAPYIEFVKESGINKEDIDKILGKNAYHLLEIEDCKN